MMTSARPMAMSRSRVQTRISFRREWVVEGAGAEVSGTDGARGWFWSVLCIFVLPSIYSMAVMDGARMHLCAALATDDFAAILSDSRAAGGRCLWASNQMAPGALGYSGDKAKLSVARAATTAVSVRSMS